MGLHFLFYNFFFILPNLSSLSWMRGFVEPMRHWLCTNKGEGGEKEEIKKEKEGLWVGFEWCRWLQGPSITDEAPYPSLIGLLGQSIRSRLHFYSQLCLRHLIFLWLISLVLELLHTHSLFSPAQILLCILPRLMYSCILVF